MVVTLDFLSLGDPFNIVFRLVEIEDFFCFLSSPVSLASDDEEDQRIPNGDHSQNLREDDEDLRDPVDVRITLI